MRIGFIEPHMGRFGGIRRVVELGNHLVARGHDVAYYVPPTVEAECSWMPCAGSIHHLQPIVDDPLDFIIYNNEPDWHYLAAFPNATRKVYFALHYAKLYEKEGSWECLQQDVDLLLANSTWTADMIEADIGIRPETFSGGINVDHFHPLQVPKEYAVLSVGDDRPWKGQDLIEEAAELLGAPVERYNGKDLPQSAMAEEYAKAEVFVVGSDFEGFGQPGIEALACGTPLVTTDNGGCRDYAIDRETALVVPPRRPEAMAAAIREIRSDPELANQLRTAGLELVRDRFSWSKSAADLEAILERALNGELSHRRGKSSLRNPPLEPAISLVVLPWDQLALTQRCLTSLRLHTDVPYELVVVDNGSEPIAQSYASQAADVAILNTANRGFAAGMNQGLAASRGEFVAFINNDTFFSPGWASKLLNTFEANPKAGIVVPAVTAAANPVNVMDEPGNRVYPVPAFSAPPGAVVWVMRTDLAKDLGGFPEEYEIASGEDVDLAFTVWVNDLDIVVDERVLVRHVSKGTAAAKLDDWRGLWKRNRDQFLDKWTDPDVPAIRTADCSEATWFRNRSAAVGAATWMRQYFQTRESLEEAREQGKAKSTADRERAQQDLAKVRQQYDRLRGRRSVRIALTLSGLLEPLIRIVKRNR